MDAAFREDYASTPSSILSARYGVSGRTIARWAAKLGLRKSHEYRSQLAAELSTRRDPSRVPRGPAHYNWKGGRPWERFRDPRYLAWRGAVLQRDAYRCQLCGRQCAKHERGLAAHHVQTWASAPDHRFDVENGRTLCRDCHMRLHGRALPPTTMRPCACGCGTLIPDLDPYGRSRRFVNRHGKRGVAMPVESRQRMSLQRRSRSITPEHRAKISAALRRSNKRIGRPPRVTSVAAPRSS